MAEANWSLLGKVLERRRELEQSNSWTHEQLVAHQRAAVAELRRFAMERSPFYARFHRGMEGRQLDELPVVTKRIMMESFDDLVTDRSVRLADVEAFLTSGGRAGLFRERYVALETSGTSGLRGVCLLDEDEWLTALASMCRPMAWAETRYDWLQPTRTAMITATAPAYFSARVGEALSNPLMPSLLLDASEPLGTMVEKLNAWRPVMLAAYPSVLRALAEEQIAGRLRIPLRQAASSAEALSADVRHRVQEAWNARVYNTYAATEYALIAAECRYGRMHLLEDGAVIEIADENGPVPVGVQGNRVLLTVFASGTLPLIRYELNDLVRAVAGRCECGRPFQMIETVEGRNDDVLLLAARDAGTAWIHPNALQQAVETAPWAGWQLIVLEDGLTVHLVGARDREAMEKVAPNLRAMLEEHGAAPVRIEVCEVADVERGRTGKAARILRRARGVAG